MEEMMETTAEAVETAEATEPAEELPASDDVDTGEAIAEEPTETPVEESAEPAPAAALPQEYADLPARIGRQIVKTVRLERELQRMQRMVREYRRADELRSLQAHDPTANLTDLAALGEDYARLRRAGVGAVAAYEAVKYQRAKGEIPPDTGALGSDRAQEKEFYTPDEVDRLTSRELDDPKIMERVMRSMTKWK
ncbi:MAG: hypothetical protein E7452_06060 [Ruminococcaceae bacterium]|nr:hypothetical protein [Oscillospiraceae bacterium]